MRHSTPASDLILEALRTSEGMTARDLRSRTHVSSLVLLPTLLSMVEDGIVTSAPSVGGRPDSRTYRIAV